MPVTSHRPGCSRETRRCGNAGHPVSGGSETGARPPLLKVSPAAQFKRVGGRGSDGWFSISGCVRRGTSSTRTAARHKSSHDVSKGTHRQVEHRLCGTAPSAVSHGEGRGNQMTVDCRVQDVIGEEDKIRRKRLDVN